MLHHAAARSVAGTAANAAAGDSQPASGAQIAYSYSWGFRVEAQDLPILQERHRALCAAMAGDCRILNLSRSGSEDYGYGGIRMQVAASRVEEFREQLNASTQGVDAEQLSFAISGEDLSDNITDTEARLEGRRLLRDRLMEVLRTRQGSVADLVAAERGVAEVNEEIDAATSRLANLRNRVAYSAVNIEYDPMMGEYRMGFSRPIEEAVKSIGTTLGVVIAGLIYLAVALVPITAFALGLRWLWRWLWRRTGLRLRRRRDELAE